MINDLSGYLAYLSKKGRAATIREKVSTECEISAITNLENRTHRNESRALVFENVDGYDMPVATNLLGSLPTLSELFNQLPLSDLILKMHTAGKMEMLKGAKAVMDSKPKISASLSGYKRLGGLDELPVLKVWPKDSGRFITLPLVITNSPSDGSTNVGIYRMQVFDSETTGMHWQSQKGGAIHAAEAAEAGTALKVSVAIGTDPYNLMAAVAPLPQGINEFAFSGMMRGSSTNLVRNGEYPAVPSNSEIVINGHVDGEKKMEGPFGDHTGYYSIPEPAHVFHVDAIYAKEHPIYAASVVGFPWSEDAVAAEFLSGYLKPMIKAVNTSIVDIYLPSEGAFTNMCFISIKKRFPGDAKKAMFGILGLGQLSLTKIVVAFDDDVNIRDLSTAMWALSTRVDPERDIQIIKGTSTDSLDHASSISAYGSKVLIDATKKTREEGYARGWPETISMDGPVESEAEKKWKRIK